MTSSPAARKGRLRFDIDDGPLELEGVDFASCEQVTVDLAVAALGSANSHISISLSLLDVAWAVEKLAAEAEATTISVGGYFNRQVTARFKRPRARFANALPKSR